MDINQIIIIAIIILVGVILVFGTYFLITFINQKNKEKKVNNIFNPNNLVEEESLLNTMDEKRNLEEKEEQKESTYIEQEVNFDVHVNQQTLDYQKKINPFNVDMTMRSNDNSPIIDEENKNNKYFK